MATKTYYDTTNQTSTVLDSDIIVVQHDNGGSYSSDLNQMMKTTVSAIRNGAQANVLEGISFRGSGQSTYSDLTIDSKKAILDLSNYVLSSRTINNQALTGNIELEGDDIKLSSTYSVPSSESQPAINDSIDTAVGKLQSEINAKTDAISEIIETISGIASGLTFKGKKTRAEINALTGMSVGDEYLVSDEGIYVAWDGTSWVEVSPEVIDSLDSTSTYQALSANQGRVLAEALFPLGLYVDSEGYLCQELGE